MIDILNYLEVGNSGIFLMQDVYHQPQYMGTLRLQKAQKPYISMVFGPKSLNIKVLGALGIHGNPFRYLHNVLHQWALAPRPGSLRGQSVPRFF